MSSDWRKERIAKNEASFREINERLEEDRGQVRHLPELLEFVCECGDRDCDQLLLLTRDEYEDMRRDSRRFAVVRGHVFPEVEHLLARHDRFDVVEKHGDTVEMTDDADRRSAGAEGRRDGPATA